MAAQIGFHSSVQFKLHRNESDGRYRNAYGASSVHVLNKYDVILLKNCTSNIIELIALSNIAAHFPDEVFADEFETIPATDYLCFLDFGVKSDSCMTQYDVSGSQHFLSTYNSSSNKVYIHLLPMLIQRRSGGKVADEDSFQQVILDPGDTFIKFEWSRGAVGGSDKETLIVLSASHVCVIDPYRGIEGKYKHAKDSVSDFATSPTNGHLIATVEQRDKVAIRDCRNYSSSAAKVYADLFDGITCAYKLNSLYWLEEELLVVGCECSVDDEPDNIRIGLLSTSVSGNRAFSFADFGRSPVDVPSPRETPAKPHHFFVSRLGQVPRNNSHSHSHPLTSLLARPLPLCRRAAQWDVLLVGSNKSNEVRALSVVRGGEPYLEECAESDDYRCAP